MAKAVKWSAWANKDLVKIVSYWTAYNMSPVYSERLIQEAHYATDLIGSQPGVGKLTNHVGIRIKLVAEHFLMVYCIRPKNIIILRFWDARQNPRKLKRYLE